MNVPEVVGADPGLVEGLSGLDVGLLTIEHFRRPNGVESPVT